MKLTVLGRYSPFPPPGGACPGYLLQHAGEALLLECGSGVVSRLQNHLEMKDLRWVILSHLHGDHSSDMAVLRYAVHTDPRRKEQPDGLDVYAPGKPDAEFASLPYKKAVRAHAVDADTRLTLGPFCVTFAPTEHPLPCHATRVRAGDDVLVYTGDTAPCGAVEDLAEGADLLLSEASLDRKMAEGHRGHMTAGQAGALARRAQAKRLLLTHFWPYHSVDRLVNDARAGCPDIPVDAAVEGRQYPV